MPLPVGHVLVYAGSALVKLGFFEPLQLDYFADIPETSRAMSILRERAEAFLIDACYQLPLRRHTRSCSIPIVQ